MRLRRYMIQVREFDSYSCELSGRLVHAYDRIERLVDTLGSLCGRWGDGSGRVFRSRGTLWIDEKLYSLPTRTTRSAHDFVCTQ